MPSSCSASSSGALGAQVSSAKRTAVAYLRVSTDRQAEHGLGLQVQEATIRTWAKREGVRIVAVYRDEGISGSNGLDTRDGLADALRAIRDGSAGGLAVYRLDRLARDLVLQEQLLAEVWRMDGEVYSTASGEADLRDDPDDPSRRMIRQILGAVSEYERSMIALRLRRGRTYKAEQGGYAGFGSPPFGYRAEDRELVAADDERDTVARIVELHDAGRSLREVVAVLADEGRRPKRGDRWYPQTVARVIARQRGQG